MSFFEQSNKALNLPLYQFGIANSIKVELENIDAPTNASEPFLAGFMLYVPTEQADLSYSEYRQGIYQIDIAYPTHIGQAPIMKMADLLNQTFKTGVSFEFENACVSIQSVDLSPLIVSGGWAKRSLSVNWDAYTIRL